MSFTSIIDKRIPELPNQSNVSALMQIPIYDPITDTTYRMNYAIIQPGASTADYRWNPSVDYGVGDIVTNSDKIWESLVTPNLNQVPLEGGGFWTERSKSKSGFAYWQAGVFTDDDVYVLYTLGGNTFFYELVDPARPYNSTDFEDELADDKWRRIGTIEDILGTVLDGLVLTDASDITDDDTILEALGKAQRILNDIRDQWLQRNGSEPMTGNLDMDGNTIINLPEAIANGQPVTFEQLNAAIDGLKPKDDCRAATTGNITLNGEQTIDGVNVVDLDRVLVKDQSAEEENGIYYVVDGGDWIRDTDADTALELQGAFVQISEGTTNINTAWVQYAVDFVLDTDPVLWRQVSSTVPDASPTTKGKVKLAGDLSGTADAPTVPGLATKQPLDDELTALAAVVSAADKLPYFTGSGAAAVTDFTALARALVALVGPGAIRFFKVNADNTVSLRTAAEMIGDLGAEATANKGIAGGYAPLNGSNQIPAIHIPDTHFKGKYISLVALQTAYPTADDGDYAIVDAGAGNDAKEYIWDEDEGWIQGSGASIASAVVFTPAGNLASTNVQAALEELDNEKAADDEVVHLTGNESIDGVKTFNDPPVVPDPTVDGEAANKGYVDSKTFDDIRIRVAITQANYLMTR